MLFWPMACLKWERLGIWPSLGRGQEQDNTLPCMGAGMGERGWEEKQEPYLGTWALRWHISQWTLARCLGSWSAVSWASRLNVFTRLGSCVSKHRHLLLLPSSPPPSPTFFRSNESVLSPQSERRWEVGAFSCPLIRQNVVLLQCGVWLKGCV